jgi:hypothetical protein
MKVLFIIHQEHHKERIFQLMRETHVEYYSQWENIKTSLKTKNDKESQEDDHEIVTMVTCRKEELLYKLAERIEKDNTKIKEPKHKIHVFPVPLDRLI